MSRPRRRTAETRSPHRGGRELDHRLTVGEGASTTKNEAARTIAKQVGRGRGTSLTEQDNMYAIAAQQRLARQSRTAKRKTSRKQSKQSRKRSR